MNGEPCSPDYCECGGQSPYGCGGDYCPWCGNDWKEICDPDCEKFTICTHNKRNCAPIFNKGLDIDESVPSSGFECRNCGELMPVGEFKEWLRYPWWIKEIPTTLHRQKIQALADSL
jgi:hypothetical protein